MTSCGKTSTGSARRLRTRTTSDGILAVVLDTAIGSAQATGGAIMFLDADGNLTVQVRRGEVAESVDVGTVVPLGKGISGQVAVTGEPVCGQAGEGPGLRRVPSEPDAASVIAVPLKQSGRIVGVLNLYDKAGAREFTAAQTSTRSSRSARRPAWQSTTCCCIKRRSA